MTAELLNSIAPTALIVEDRPEIAKMWAELLQPLGILMTFATTLREALEQIVKVPPPDLILLDLALTDSMAIDTVEQIGAMRRMNPEAVVMVISGMVTPELSKIAIERGAHTVLHKLEIKRQTDLWRGIQRALDKAPKAAKHKFEHTIELIESLTCSILSQA